MDHLSEERFDRHLFDGMPLTTEEAAHLAACAACQATFATLRAIATELSIARQSKPPPPVRARAYQLFAQIQQQPSWLERIVQRLQGQLIWDSRQQSAAQGLRDLPDERYHLLYTTEVVEVELSVQPLVTGFALAGELLPLRPDDALTPALVHLQPANPAGRTYETLSDAEGHFRLQGVAAGSYRLLLTPPTGALVEIEGLEFA